MSAHASLKRLRVQEKIQERVKGSRTLALVGLHVERLLKRLANQEDHNIVVPLLGTQRLQFHTKRFSRTVSFIVIYIVLFLVIFTSMWVYVITKTTI